MRRNATTAKSAVDSEFQVLVVNETGKHEALISCHNIDQCRDVVRVDAKLYGPYTLFFVNKRGRAVERSSVGLSDEAVRCRRSSTGS